jgi:hypothetical protein
MERSKKPGNQQDQMEEFHRCPMLQKDLQELRRRGTQMKLGAGVKRPGREASHSLSTSAEVKKTRLYTYIPPYAFMT